MKKNVLFDDMDLSDLLKVAYDRTTSRRKMISDIATVMSEKITDVDSSIIIGPILKEYLDVLARSDEHVLKIAGIAQKMIASDVRGGAMGDVGSILSESERNALLQAASIDLTTGLAIPHVVRAIPAVSDDVTPDE